LIKTKRNLRNSTN